MKKNLGMFFGLPSWGMGAVLLALCAFTPVSRADVIVDNTGTPFTSISGAALAQVFTMSGTSGNISSLTLELFSSGAGTVNVDLYNVSAGAPTGSATLLGTVTTTGAGNGQLIAVSSLNNALLNASTQYAIVLEQSGTVQWDFIDNTASGGTGSLGSQYTSTDSGATWVFYGNTGGMQMNLQTTPVPEVPITGAVMGFGVLAIALGRTLRRKLSTAV